MKTNGSALAVAIVAPLLVGLIGTAAFFFIAGGYQDLFHLLQEGGWTTYVSISAAWFSTVVSIVCGLLIAKGRRVPIAIPIAAATLPWAIGLGGMLLGLTMVEAALAMVDPMEAARLFAAGVGECFKARLLGAWISGVLLLGVAPVLLVASFGDQERRFALLTGAALAGAGAIFALPHALQVLAVSEALGGVARIAPDEAAAVLASSLSNAARLSFVVKPGLALLAIAAIAHLGASFVVPRPGRIADAIVAVLALVVMYGADALFARTAITGAHQVARSPWEGTPDFQPVDAPETYGGGGFDGAITQARAELSDLGLPVLRDRSSARREDHVGIALDRRLDRRQLERVFAALERARIKEVSLFGESRAFGEEVLQLLGDDAALIAPLAFRRNAVRVSTRLADLPDSDQRVPLGQALAPVSARSHSLRASLADPLSAEVVDGKLLSMRQSGNPVMEVRLDDPAPPQDGAQRMVLLLPRSNAADLVRAADVLHRRDFRPVVLSKPIAPPPPDPILYRPLDDVPTTGTLSAEQIRKVMKRAAPRIRVCYERRLMKVPDLSGKIVLAFVIGSDGEVPDATVASTTMEDAEVETCVLDVVKGLGFPRPKGGKVKVTYPFVFQPSS